MALQQIEYTADTSGYIMTNTGTWSTGTGTYYYHIFELEVGKGYIINMPANASNPLTRWRNSLADSNVIGSANLMPAVGIETPVDGVTIAFTATQPYLISYGGTTGGIVELDIYDDVAELPVFLTEDIGNVKYNHSFTQAYQLSNLAITIEDADLNLRYRLAPGIFTSEYFYLSFPKGKTYGLTISWETVGIASYPGGWRNRYGGASYTDKNNPLLVQEDSKAILDGLQSSSAMGYIRFLSSTYSITYYPNGGTPEPTNLTDQTHLPAQLPTVSKTGYTFDGWFYDSTFTSPATAGDALTNNVNLYAKFTLVPIPDTTYDLSTRDWTSGSHSLTFVSQATGYRDADPSSPALTFTIYAVSIAATNGTLSPAVTKIAPWETKTITLTAETGYSVPASVVTPTGVTYTKTSSTTATIAIDGSLVAAAITLPLVCVNKLATPTGVEATGTVVSFNPVENAESYYIYADGSQIGTFTPSGPTPSMPSKGDLIEMDLGAPTPAAGIADTYRVLSVDGNIAYVVAMFDADTRNFGSNNTYSGSALDTYLNSTWYGALSSIAKSAIVDKTFQQDSWYWGTGGDPDYSGFYGETNPGTSAYTISLGSTTFGSEITRHVYALGIQDVVDLLSAIDTSGTPLQNYNFWNTFWGDTVSHSGSWVWLRSALAGYSSTGWVITGKNGRVDYIAVSSANGARPAFQIDLSKITWTPSN